MLAEMLITAGYRVAVVNSGRQALELLSEQPFDAILADLHMPELDGPGLHQALLTAQSPLAKRLIFVTGDSLGEGRTRVPDDTVTVVEKPFNIVEITAALERLFGARQSPSEGERV